MDTRYGVFHIVMVSRIPLEYELYEKEVISRGEMNGEHKTLGELVEGTEGMHKMLEVLQEHAEKYYDFRIIN